MASGQISFEEVGESYPVEEVVECAEYHIKPELSENEAKCFVMTGLKHFGGIQFNITNKEWKEKGYKIGDIINTKIYYKNNLVFDKDILYGNSFGDVNVGEPIIYCGSSLFLSLDLNQANFMATYNINTGVDYTVELKKIN